MEMQETERELRRTLDQIDPRPNRSAASSTPPASSPSRSRPPSNETENIIQPPAAKLKPPQAQAAVPGGESSAKDGAGSSDGAGSKDKDTAENTNTEEYD